LGPSLGGDASNALVYIATEAGVGPVRPTTVSFENQCGRVLFST
jgi:hypothetical protein